MPQYEYEIVILAETREDKEAGKKITTGTFEEKMCKLGKQGFRFVGLRQGVQSGVSFYYPLAIMEREVDADPETDTEARKEDDRKSTATRPAYEWDEWEKKTHTD